MKRSIRFLALAGSVFMSICAAGPAAASGPPPEGPAYIDAFGGETADLNRFYAGAVGVVTASSPRARLFMAWRLLHGLPVGEAAGPPLSIPCCDNPDAARQTQVYEWLKIRVTVPGVAERTPFLETDRPVGQGAEIANCFDDAFRTASETLLDRTKRFGLGSPWVKAWVDAQDAVFDGCHQTGVALPAIVAGAPDWFKADHAYQAAALALYQGDNAGAAGDFAAIGRDANSPWRPMALYLTARARMREVKRSPSPATFAQAHRALDALRAAPAGTFGQGELAAMTQLVAQREHPDQARAALDAELNGPTLTAAAAADFRDYVDLNEKSAPRPQILDWIDTLKDEDVDVPAIDAATDDAARAARQRRIDALSLAHAQARYAATHDPAWLIAALSVVDPSDPAARALGVEAASVAPSNPAFLTVAYHRIRLTIRSAPVEQSRAALDAILARADLSTTDRNLFTAERMQVAEDPHRFAVLALRHRLCADYNQKDGCVRGNYNSQMEASGVYDASGTVGLGPDARALIDRLSLGPRGELAGDSGLPDTLRLDIALTTWVRAVLMQDNGHIDLLARRLERLLPQLGPDWARVAATPPGADKRFAEFFVFVKIPGLATDLQTYTRPEGAVPQFQGSWNDWMILPAGSTAGDSAPPPLLAYYPDGGGSATGQPVPDSVQWPTSDLVCLSYCGQGAFPLRQPPFIAAAIANADLESKRMIAPYRDAPAGAASMWDEVLDYAKAHPRDPRSPETFYWLVHVGHFGHSHNHLGHRAFDLLHKRYPTSSWAKQTKYYYD